MIRFNVSTDNYMTFIQQVRDWAKDPKRISHGRPVLPYPPTNLNQVQYMDIELRAKDSNQKERFVTVKIRRHDLYIVGYRMEAANQWLEFDWGKGQPTVIPKSESLRFGANYDKLGNLESLDKVGYNKLKNVIVALAETKNPGIRKSSLLALAVMIPESVRFQKLSDLFALVMQKKQDMKFEIWMINLITSWSDLSNRLLCEDHFRIPFRLPDDQKTTNTHILTRTKELAIRTSTDAAKCIAVLLGNHPNKDALQPHTKQDGTVLGWKGSSILQVFSVCVNKIAGEVYGKIEVTDEFGTCLLYNRSRNDYEYIQKSDILTITGPNRGLSAKSFKVSVSLMKRAQNPPADDNIINGSFEWKVGDINQYLDKRVHNTVKGKNGCSATVYYTPFRDAVLATVEVVPLSGGGNKDVVELYGTVIARYGNYEYRDDAAKLYYRTVLFKKPSKVNNVKVKHGNSIPLSRSVVAVPTRDSLVIDANILSVSSGNSIADDSPDFPCQLDGSSMKDIGGQYGHVRITVFWKAKISA
ncbi:Protein synthesis inhibitor II [Bienertia sinuspersici]